ncbi:MULTISPECIES: DUF1203 domain-containing protein [Aquimarina]|nr:MULTISPECIES: DUF1203 domain-containing protein [Aquimarina]
MRNFKIVPLSEEYALQIKTEKKDDYGLEVMEQLSTGAGPCRVSLQPFEIGKDIRLVFRHSPFDIKNAFDQPGPVFIHKKPVKAYEDIYNFPPGIKKDRDNFPLSLIGYNQEQKMVFTKLVGDEDVDELIEKIFKNHHNISYLHARNSEACCFICKIERL